MIVDRGTAGSKGIIELFAVASLQMVHKLNYINNMIKVELNCEKAK